MTQTNTNYPNPLDNFRSYSYQFVMTVAGTTEAFRKMVGGGGAAGSTQPAPLLQAVNTSNIGDQINIEGERAYLLMDTRRFSQFAITNMSLGHIYGTGNPNNPSMPATTHTMTLIDTTGLSFVNMLMDIMRNKLQSSSASVFYLLAILFIGHDDEGNTETISTTYIPFSIMQLGFSFTSTGAIYEIAFVELQGGNYNQGTGTHNNYLGTINSVTTQGRANTLGGLISSLEQQLNVNSFDMFQKYNNAVQAAGATNSNPTSNRFGKLVQYMITLPDGWSDFELSAAAQSANLEKTFLANGATQKVADDQLATAQVALFNLTQGQGSANATPAEIAAAKSAVTQALNAQNKTAAANTAAYKASQENLRPLQQQTKNNIPYSQMSFSSNTEITDAIRDILECCEAVLNLASEGKRKAGTAVLWKVVPNITCDDISFTLHFDVFAYPIEKPVANTTSTLSAGSTNTQIVSGPAGTIRNLLTYDYLFSGFNSHIKDLNINFDPYQGALIIDTNVSLGKPRMAVLSAAGQTTQAVNSASDGQKSTTKSAPDVRASDPIFFPIRTSDQQTNGSGMNLDDLPTTNAFKIAQAKAEYQQTLATVHFMSSASLEMTVRGNPNIIKKFADASQKGGLAPHTVFVTGQELSAIPLNITVSNAQQDYLNLEAKVQGAKAKYIKDYITPKVDSVQKALATSGGSKDALLNGLDPICTPLYAQVNIYAPNIDYTTADFKDGEDLYTNQFFYQGPYFILSIVTNFTNGEFTHVFSMIPFNTDDSYSNNTSTAPTPKTL